MDQLGLFILPITKVPVDVFAGEDGPAAPWHLGPAVREPVPIQHYPTGMDNLRVGVLPIKISFYPLDKYRNQFQTHNLSPSH